MNRVQIFLILSSNLPTETFFGTMFTSDDRGILFSKSLERHLFDGHRKSDFTNITSLRGVYLTNKLDHGRPDQHSFFIHLLTYALLISTFLINLIFHNVPLSLLQTAE